MSMDYLSINRNAYDKTAEEFRSKISSRKRNDEMIVKKLCKYLARESSIKILDIGPGNGQMAKMLCDKGYEVVGIEFSEPLAMVAQNTAPQLKMIIDNFLTHDFGKQKFSGILVVAFIHLFPRNDCLIVIKKIYDLLDKDGYALITTTKHEKSEEGFLSKDNFQDNSLRFRKKFTIEELQKILVDEKFQIVEYGENKDGENSRKTWMTFIVKK